VKTALFPFFRFTVFSTGLYQKLQENFEMRRALCLFVLCIAVNSLAAVSAGAAEEKTVMANERPQDLPRATLAGGCFWCLESEYRGRKGVVYTVVGYTGGSRENPAYRDVTTGETGHAEAVENYFDIS
jgi:hypothetical protein